VTAQTRLRAKSGSVTIAAWRRKAQGKAFCIVYYKCAGGRGIAIYTKFRQFGCWAGKRNRRAFTHSLRGWLRWGPDLALAQLFRSEALLEPCHSQLPRGPLHFTDTPPPPTTFFQLHRLGLDHSHDPRS
jgi:hypothetical protein